MLKKLIKYTDYDGRERSENFYFYMSKAELMEMELGTVGGMQNLIQLIIDKQDIPKIMEAFKTIILKAYGEKSPDGRRFIKSAELSEAFSQTEAYSNLYMELITNADAAAAFINGIVPEDVAQAAAVARKEREESEVTDEAEKPVEKVEDNADAPVRLLNN
jgi:hypothetical protein